MPRYVLDTSAILAFLFGEEGAQQVGELFAAGPNAPGEPEILLPYMALMETEYLLLRRRPPHQVTSTLLTIEGWPAEIRESTPEWRHEAARVKARGGLSLADAWIAALAMLEDADLVHKDPELDGVPGLKALRLPIRP